MQEKPTNNLSPKIAVIGVGGGGGNAVNNMIADNLEGCDFIVCNSDSQALSHSLCDTTIQLGTTVTGGLGAGSKPDIGRAAAEESLDDVMQHLEGANMAFVTAGMGGGTGTGAAPIIAKACRERGILTVGVVTKPFHFEGSHRMELAEAGLKEMQEHVDTLIVIPNQNLFRIANEKTTFADGFKMADSVLQSGVRGVTDLMVKPGLVNLDFADIRTAMLEMGKAMMGTGEATGEKRAIEAAEAAINNPLLDDVTMKGARGVIINVTGGYDMTLFEADEACNRIRDEVDPKANIIFGATFDSSMDGSMRVSIVATGIEKESMMRRGGGTGGGSTLERAVPNQPTTETTLTEMTETTSTTTAYKTGADNLEGITAPVTMPIVEAAQETTAAPTMAEPDADLFEQNHSETAAAPQDKALRGSVYKDSFIPPSPALPSGAMGGTASTPTQAAPEFPSAPVRTAAQQPTGTASSGLVLNPPKMKQDSDVKKAPSFFERLAGTVQQHLDTHLGGGHEKAEYSAPQPAPRRTVSSPTLGGGMSAPSQGQLNIESPAGTPAAKGAEDELDIPAFLRRQAN